MAITVCLLVMCLLKVYARSLTFDREDEQDIREKRKKEGLHYKKKLAEKDKR